MSPMDSARTASRARHLPAANSFKPLWASSLFASGAHKLNSNWGGMVKQVARWKWAAVAAHFRPSPNARQPRLGVRKGHFRPITWQILGCGQRRRVPPAHRTCGGENQKVAQNVGSSKKVMGRDSSANMPMAISDVQGVGKRERINNPAGDATVGPALKRESVGLCQLRIDVSGAGHP